MRRSGMSHMTATTVYSPQANHRFTKESGMATAYSASDAFPLKSAPNAAASAESVPS